MPTPRFSSMYRIIIDTEGQASEPLCPALGFDQCESFSCRDRGIFRPRSGWDPEEASSAQPLQSLAA